MVEKFWALISRSIGMQKVSWIILFWVSIYCVIILQDYLYSVIRDTGFYWSEVTLFNLYWLLFIPFSILIKKLSENGILPTIASKKPFILFFLNGLIITSLHVLCFSTTVAFLSFCLFSPAHLFENILRASISNDLYVTLLVYTFFPTINFYFQKSKNSKKDLHEEVTFRSSLTVKIGKTTRVIDVDTIEYFSSSKPYTIAHVGGERHLLDSSLKQLSESLDPQSFIRVHKSYLIHVKSVTKLESRGNGDYDAVLKSGGLIRLSRHYRKEWDILTHTKLHN